MANVDLSLADLEHVAQEAATALESVQNLIKLVDTLPFLGKYGQDLDEVETVLSFLVGVLSKV